MSDLLSPSSPDPQPCEQPGDRPKRDAKTYYGGVQLDHSSCLICRTREDHARHIQAFINDLNVASANARYLVAKLARSMAVPGIPRVERQSDSGESSVGGQRNVAVQRDDVDTCRWIGDCRFPNICTASWSVCHREEG